MSLTGRRGGGGDSGCEVAFGVDRGMVTGVGASCQQSTHAASSATTIMGTPSRSTSEDGKLEALMEQLALGAVNANGGQEEKQYRFDTYSNDPYPVGFYSRVGRSQYGGENNAALPKDAYFSTITRPPVHYHNREFDHTGYQTQKQHHDSTIPWGWHVYIQMRMCETGETNYEVAEARVMEMCRWVVEKYCS